MPNGNGELKSAAEKAEQKAELPPKEEIKQEQKPQEPPKDFKIAEIWIKEGQLILDASPEFWMDKLRALGTLEMCKDIVKDFKQDRNKIIPAKNSMLNFARNFRNKFRKR